MELGFGLPVCGSWATPENQIKIAHRAEELGYASLWTIQRLLYAEEPREQYYGAPGQQWPSYFVSVVDPIVTLSYIAAHTQRIRLGTAALNLPFTNPPLLAKQLATLDLVSHGRLDVGAGLGWSQDEHVATSTPYTERGARFDEFLQCLVAAWTQPVVHFEGDHYEIPRSQMEPKPVQSPHPPLLIGGYSRAALRRATTIGQGYLGGNLPFDEIAPLISRLRELTRDHGDDRPATRLVTRGVTMVTDRSSAGPATSRRPLCGTFEQIEGDIERYREAGVTELFLDLNLDAKIGSVDADPEASMELAMATLEQFAPKR